MTTIKINNKEVIHRIARELYINYTGHQRHYVEIDGTTYRLSHEACIGSWYICLNMVQTGKFTVECGV